MYQSIIKTESIIFFVHIINGLFNYYDVLLFITLNINQTYTFV